MNHAQPTAIESHRLESNQTEINENSKVSSLSKRKNPKYSKWVPKVYQYMQINVKSKLQNRKLLRTAARSAYEESSIWVSVRNEYIHMNAYMQLSRLFPNSSLPVPIFSVSTLSFISVVLSSSVSLTLSLSLCLPLSLYLSFSLSLFHILIPQSPTSISSSLVLPSIFLSASSLSLHLSSISCAFLCDFHQLM